MVFAATSPTLKQPPSLSEHAVRWQLAPVVPRLGNIALMVWLILSYQRAISCEVCRKSLGVTRIGGDVVGLLGVRLRLLCDGWAERTVKDVRSSKALGTWRR